MTSWPWTVEDSQAPSSESSSRLMTSNVRSPNPSAQNSRHARTSRAIRFTCSSRRTFAPAPRYRWWLDFIAGRSAAGGRYFVVS
jgi:hypothetical protein